MPKVLLVEDDNNLREIFQMRLQAEGYTAITAADGEEGLVVAMKEKPDLVIADVMMPKLSGFEMVENLRSAPEMKDAKVIMMTALGQAEDQARGEKLGVVKYLVKSQVTLEDFARVVKEVLGPGSPEQTAAPAAVLSNNSQESENSMQEDASQTNPTPMSNDTPATEPAAASMPAGDPAAPAADSGAQTMAADSSQQSSAEEQSVVQDQINSFSGNSMDSPATDHAAASMPAGDPAAPAADTTGAPAVPPATEPPATPDEPPAASSDQSGTAPTDPTSNAL